jgi:hypothetical protein
VSKPWLTTAVKYYNAEKWLTSANPVLQIAQKIQAETNAFG